MITGVGGNVGVGPVTFLGRRCRICGCRGGGCRRGRKRGRDDASLDLGGRRQVGGRRRLGHRLGVEVAAHGRRRPGRAGVDVDRGETGEGLGDRCQRRFGVGLVGGERRPQRVEADGDLPLLRVPGRHGPGHAGPLGVELTIGEFLRDRQQLGGAGLGVVDQRHRLGPSVRQELFGGGVGCDQDARCRLGIVGGPKRPLGERLDQLVEVGASVLFAMSVLSGPRLGAGHDRCQRHGRMGAVRRPARHCHLSSSFGTPPIRSRYRRISEIRPEAAGVHPTVIC